MVKHRRYSDQPKEDSAKKEEKTELQEQEISSEKTTDFKSLLLSGTKYIYIITAVALLSGIFTPFTLGLDIQDIIIGMLIIFFGLGGGIVLFLGINYRKLTTVMICGGLGMMIISLFLIYELIDRPLLG